MKKTCLCTTCKKWFAPPARWNRIALPTVCLPCWAEKVEKASRVPYDPKYYGGVYE